MEATSPFEDDLIAITLSGRILPLNIRSGREILVAELRRRVANDYGHDDEVGSEFEMVDGDGKLLEEEALLYLPNMSMVAIKKKRYHCLVEHLLHSFQPWKKWMFRIALVAIGSLFMAAMAQISFYLPHANTVPVTFQTLGVLMIGSLYGWKLGMITVIVYLLEGLVGAPFFSQQSGGFLILKGPTCGYLYGFILSAFIVGVLAERGHDRFYVLHYWRSTFVSMIIGDLSIYVIGVPVLWHYYGAKIAWTKGFLPFFGW